VQYCNQKNERTDTIDGTVSRIADMSIHSDRLAKKSNACGSTTTKGVLRAIAEREREREREKK